MGHMVRVCLVLQETAKLSPTVTIWFILHSHQQWVRVPATPDACHYLVLSVSWIWAILIGVWWFLIVILLCISLMIYDVEHLFICLPAICISSLVRYLFRSFAHFLIGWLIFLLSSFKCSLYILDNSPISDTSFANICFVCGLLSYSFKPPYF